MKIKAVGHEIYTRDPATKKTKIYKVGETFDLDDKEAERLIKLGYAEKSGGGGYEPPKEKHKDKGGE